MAHGRNTTVIGVRVTDELADRLKSEAMARKLDFSDYMRALLNAYWHLPTKVRVATPDSEGVERITEYDKEFILPLEPKLGRKPKEVEKKIYKNGLPRKDNKGNLIPETKWDFAKEHRRQDCPCGSGKKFKNCHGAIAG